MDEKVQIPSKLLSQLSSAAAILRRHEFFRVVSHYDADGISAAAIVCQTLQRLGKEYQASMFKSLGPKEMEAIAAMDCDCLIISDMGASYVKELEALSCDVIILDHHWSEDDSDRILHINPHLHGIDGMTDACGASMSMLLALAVSEGNWDLAPLAMAGMAGDRQHSGATQGINQYITDGALQRGLAKRLDGCLVPSGTLTESLYLSTEPFITGVSGCREGVAALMEEVGIGISASAESLEQSQRRKLSSLIALRLLRESVSLAAMNEVARSRHFLPSWEMDSESLASLIDACGRLDLEGIGLGAAMGDGNSLLEALENERSYREELVQSVLEVQEAGITQMDNIQYFHVGPGGSAGVVGGIAMSFFADPNKPTFGLSRKEDGLRISGRANWRLLERGVDLSVALREACRKAGGGGGGHRIASGGSVPLENEGMLLQELDALVGSQITSS